MESKVEIQIVSNTKELVAEGVASTVYRARIKRSDGLGVSWIAIKSASSRQKFCPEPHDVIKEATLLSSISHQNIINFLASKTDPVSGTMEILTSWIPFNLEDLLDDPAFTPTPYPASVEHLLSPEAEDASPSRAEVFSMLSMSIVYQLVLALSFLHTRTPAPIAHRDIKPRNVLLTESGCVKLIDFGIAYCEEFSSAPSNVWPERPNGMYCDVATGPYRAPELIFGPCHYDAIATDLWSLGVTVAQFYTPIRLQRSSYGYEDNSDSEDDDETDTSRSSSPDRPSYFLPASVDWITYRSSTWRREPLFDSSRGSIGLAWSIFKLRGTPSKETWPDFEMLPDASKVQFIETPCVRMKPRLPNLPEDVEDTGPAHAIPSEYLMRGTPLDLIHRLLVYPPSDRLAAVDILKHPWFTDAHGVLVPPELQTTNVSQEHQSNTWNGQQLGYWIRASFGRACTS